MANPVSDWETIKPTAAADDWETVDNEWETVPTPKRGFISEAGVALGRGFINLGQAVVGAGEKLFAQPAERYAALGGSWSPAKPTVKGQAAMKAKFQGVQSKMESARSDMAPTWKGLSGWAVNTLGEGAPYLAATIGSGGTVGPIGPIMIGFTMGGEAAYKKAIADGASEDRAMQEYALGGIAEAALESWGVSKLLKFKKAGKGSLKLLVGNLKKRLWKEAGGNVKSITGNMLKSALVEGLEEASQSGAGFAINALPGGSKLPRKADGSVDIGAMIKQIGMEGAGGALLGAVVPAGMNVPSGLGVAADPSIGLIKNSARKIQANEKLGEFEKARAIRNLRELLPEDYQYQGEQVAGEEVQPTEATVTEGKGEGVTQIKEPADLTVSSDNKAPVTDNTGTPITVYHGTTAEFDKFSEAKLGVNTGAPSSKMGFFFASDPTTSKGYLKADRAKPKVVTEVAIATAKRTMETYEGLTAKRHKAQYAKWKAVYEDLLVKAKQQKDVPVMLPTGVNFEMQGNIRSANLIIQNPKIVKMQGRKRSVSYAKIISDAKKTGHDGVVITNTTDGGGVDTIWVVFSAKQIIDKDTSTVGEFDQNVLTPAKAGEAKPVDPFHLTDQQQQVLDTADKFEKNLSEYEARRPELEKGTSKQKGAKFAKFQAVLNSLKGQDPRMAVNKARKATEGLAREVFPEFSNMFTAEDIKTMQRAVNESTLVDSQKLTITEVFDDLERGVLPHRSNIREFDRFFGTELAAIGKNKPKTWKEKAWAWAKVPGQTYKAIKASFDFSGMGIQGFMFGTSHPIRWLKAFGPGHRAMLSNDYLRLRDVMRRAHPNYNRLMTKGQLFTEANTSHTEEEFVNNFAKKIPGIGRFIAGSERAHCECLNSMRDTALDIVDEWGDDTTWGKEEELVRHISNLTGRGQGDPKGWFEKHMDIWSAGFWTPRMARADFGSLADPITKPHLRKMCAYDLVKSVATIATLTCLVSMIPGVEIEDDPRSSDIGKGKVGNQRFKLWGRYGQYLRLVAQLATEEAKSPTTGDIYHKERLDIITDFLRGKMNPVLSPGVDIATGKTFSGEKMQYDSESLTKYIAENISPLFLKDMVEAIRFQGLNHPTPLLSVLGFYGIDMATFEADARQQANVLKNDYAHKCYGKDWNQLSPPAQQLIRARYPMIRKYEEDAKREQTNFEWKGKIEQYAYDIGDKVIKSLSKDARQMYKDTGAMIPKLEQGVAYNGTYWKMTMDRYKKFQKDLKPALEKSLGTLKSRPGWDELDPTIKREMVETMTKQTIKFVRQQMINDINFADMEAYDGQTTTE